MVCCHAQLSRSSRGAASRAGTMTTRPSARPQTATFTTACTTPARCGLMYDLGSDASAAGSGSLTRYACGWFEHAVQRYRNVASQCVQLWLFAILALRKFHGAAAVRTACTPPSVLPAGHQPRREQLQLQRRWEPFHRVLPTDRCSLPAVCNN